jgi:hypothetical protein
MSIPQWSELIPLKQKLDACADLIPMGISDRYIHLRSLFNPQANVYFTPFSHYDLSQARWGIHHRALLQPARYLLSMYCAMEDCRGKESLLCPSCSQPNVL